MIAESERERERKREEEKERKINFKESFRAFALAL
jgi:hypothetical protein